MESPDEYLGRLNFLGTRGFSECRGAPLQCRDGRSQVCVCVCVLCMCQGSTSIDEHSNSGGMSPPPTSPLILPQYLFILTLSV